LDSFFLSFAKSKDTRKKKSPSIEGQETPSAALEKDKNYKSTIASQAK